METFCHMNSSGLCLPQLMGLSATSQRPFQFLTAMLEHLQGKQRTSNHCGLGCLCPKREIYKLKKVHPELKLSELSSFLVSKKHSGGLHQTGCCLRSFVGNFLFLERSSIKQSSSLEKSQLKSFLSILLKHMSNCPDVNIVMHMLQIGIKNPEEL